MLTNEEKPKNYDKAMFDKHRERWLQAMQDELNSLHENKIFELVKLIKGKRALKNKWVFKIKVNKSTSH